MPRALLLLLAAAPSIALAVPTTLSHQGRLFDAADRPVSGTRTVGFELYRGPTGGSPVWADAETLSIDRGYYSVVLGSDPANPLDDGLFAGDLFLGLTLDGAAVDMPRIELTSVPFARRAGVAENVDGGIVDATEIRIDGATVIDASGRLLATIGGDALEGLGCAVGQFPVRGPAGWGCVSPDELEITWEGLDELPAEIAALADLPSSCEEGQAAVWDASAGALRCEDLDARYVQSAQACNEGWVVDGFDAEGFPQCVPLPTSADFALSGQGCNQGFHVVGIDADGGVSCAPDVAYDGSDFVVSNQGCTGGQKVIGVDTAGRLLCGPDVDTDTTYDGSDFVRSGQGCPAGQKVAGVDASGSLICQVDADTNTLYSGNDFARSNQTCPGTQKAIGISTNGGLLCAADVDTDTNTTYDGGDFALSNRSCAAGSVMTGISSAGAPVCTSLRDAVRAYVRSECWLYVGWRDSCDGCTSAPTKWGRVQADGSCGNGAGGDNSCVTHSLGGVSVPMFGLNTDGSVDGNDKFWFGLYCP